MGYYSEMIYIETRDEYGFSDEMRQEIHEDSDCQEFIKNMGNINLVERKPIGWVERM